MAENLYIILKKEMGKNPEYRWQIGEVYKNERQGILIKGKERGVYNRIIHFITLKENKDHGRRKEESCLKLSELDEKTIDEKISRIYLQGFDRKEIEKILNNPHLKENLKSKLENAFLKYVLS